MDIGTSFNRALERFKPNAVTLIIGTVVAGFGFGLASGIPTAIVAAVVGGSTFGGMVAALASALARMATFGLFFGGIYTMFGKTVMGATPAFEDLLVPFTGGRTREFVIAGAVIQSPALLGVIPLVGGLLGGLLSLVATFLFFFTLIMVAEGADARSSLIRSKELVLANVVPVIVLGAVMFGLTFAGLLACFVGVFVTGPIALLIFTDTYLELKGAQGGQSIQTQPNPGQGGYPPG